MTDIRIGFVGDSLTLGTGDEAFLGWPGRACQREVQAGHDVSLYNLGIRADTTTMIEARWRAEANERLKPENNCALIFSFGCNDMAMENGTLRNAPEDACASARRMITEAKAWLPTIWVGPMPVNDDDMPVSSAPGRERYLSSSRNAVLSDMFQEIAAELEVPYLDIFTPLASNPEWQNCYIKGDGVHPIGRGYAIVAEHIVGWDAWRAWFDG